MIVNRYETVIIFKPTITLTYDEKCSHYYHIVDDFCKDKDGFKTIVDKIGMKDLAYEIKGSKKGLYVLYKYNGTIKDVTELERLLRIDDDVMKFMTLKTEDEEDYVPDEEDEEDAESEQDHPEEKPDALDVLLGFADYKKKVIQYDMNLTKEEKYDMIVANKKGGEL